MIMKSQIAFHDHEIAKEFAWSRGQTEDQITLLDRFPIPEAVVVAATRVQWFESPDRFRSGGESSG
jgi:hypothetical protein